MTEISVPYVTSVIDWEKIRQNLRRVAEEYYPDYYPEDDLDREEYLDCGWNDDYQEDD
jgi:hypothetical protein